MTGRRPVWGRSGSFLLLAYQEVRVVVVMGPPHPIPAAATCDRVHGVWAPQ